MTGRDTGTLKTGEVLNNTYIIEELIGSGGTGEVYRARNRVSGRETAIKILRQEYARNEQFVDLMRREASVLHEVIDDAVVRYHDLLESDSHGGFVFLVMEYIRGESLAAVMARGPVDESTLMQIARRVAQGLKASHGKNAFHRDLSPDNIILRDGDPMRAIVIDFGIAKDVNADARTVVGGGFAGKYQYAPPEQLAGQVDGRSDLYSLGMTLIAAFRGETPRIPDNLSELVRMKGEKPDISDIPQPLYDLIDRMVEPDPDQRFQSAADVVAWISHGNPALTLPPGPLPVAGPMATVVQPRGPVTAPPPRAPTLPPPVVVQPPPRGAGARIAVLVLLALAVLGGGGWYFALGPGRPLLFGPEYPVADPWRLGIAVATRGEMVVSGHAEDPVQAKAMKDALTRLNGGKPPAGEVSPATGLPSPTWHSGVLAIAGGASILDRWTLEVTEQNASLRGEAASISERDGAMAAAEAGAREGGFNLAMNITLKPQPLLVATLAEAAASLGTCGPLTVTGGDGTSIPPGGTVTISGRVAREADRDLIAAALKPALGSIKPTYDLTVINVPVCRMLGLLPATPDDRLQFLYAHGNKADPVAGDVFHDKDNPVVDLTLPANLRGYLHVIYIGVSATPNEGEVYHFLPHLNRPLHTLADIGTVAGKDRRVRLAWPEAEASFSQYGVVVEPPLGTNLFLAVVTPEPLFAEMRAAGQESVDALLKDLPAALRAQNAAIVSWRFLVTAP